MRRHLVALILLALVAAGCSSTTPSEQFPAFVYGTANSLEGYRIAVALPELLAVLPCYCGCGKSADHRSLKDCFIKADGSFDDHAAGCDLCISEAMDASQWHREGKTPREIRTMIDDKYHSYGTPTDTPPPP